MCTRVQCDRCGKPTWAGCGRHVETALAGVPPDARCRCREESTEAQSSDARPRKRFFGLFG